MSLKELYPKVLEMMLLDTRGEICYNLSPENEYFFQVLAKIQEVCKEENVEYCDDGLEAIVFTAQVDKNCLHTLSM